MPPSLPPEFRCPELANRIVLGATTSDPVRLHGAIVAAIEIHGKTRAQDSVFGPALAAAVNVDGRTLGTVATAICGHL